MSHTDQVAGTARDQTGHVKDTAKQQAQHVAGTAREEASKVLGTATEQAKGVLGELTSELSQKTEDQAGRLGERLRELSSQLRSMANSTDQQGLAVSTVESLAEQSERLADRLSQEGTSGVVGDVRRYARNNPGSFLLGAVVAGVAAGRMSRGAKDESKKPSGGRPEATYGAPDAVVVEEVAVVEPAPGAPAGPPVEVVGQPGYAATGGPAPAAEPYPADRGGRL